MSDRQSIIESRASGESIIIFSTEARLALLKYIAGCFLLFFQTQLLRPFELHNDRFLTDFVRHSPRFEVVVVNPFVTRKLK